MNFETIDDVRLGGFTGGVAVAALQASSCREVPDEPGVYLVMRPDLRSPVFLTKGTGGHSKGKDPNVAVAYLQKKWVEGTIVLNIGKAGGPRIAETLRDRLRKYMRFGQGKNSGHRGGRSIWQLRDSGDLLVFWKPTGKAVPEAVEKELIRQFERTHGVAPFANARH